MQYAITSRLNRLSLHDSSFESVLRQSQVIEMIFDWAKLEDFPEGGFRECIIMGTTKLTFSGVMSESFIIAATETEPEYTILPEDFIDEQAMIMTNSMDEKNVAKLYGFSGFNNLQWFDWSFQYDACKISWNSFVSYEDWMTGKLPGG